MTEGWETKKYEAILEELNIGLKKKFLEICNCFQMPGGIIDSKEAVFSLCGSGRGRTNERKEQISLLTGGDFIQTRGILRELAQDRVFHHRRVRQSQIISPWKC